MSAFIENGLGRTLSTGGEMIRLLMKHDIYDTGAERNPNEDSFFSKQYQARLKALEMYNEARWVSSWLSIEVDQECEMTSTGSPVEWRVRHPYWRLFGIPSRSRDRTKWSQIMISKISEIKETMVMEWLLLESRGSPCFWIGKIIAFFYREGKVLRLREERMRWLSMGLTVKHSFGTMGGIPSWPGGLKTFRLEITW